MDQETVECNLTSLSRVEDVEALKLSSVSNVETFEASFGRSRQLPQRETRQDCAFHAWSEWSTPTWVDLVTWNIMKRWQLMAVLDDTWILGIFLEYSEKSQGRKHWTQYLHISETEVHAALWAASNRDAGDIDILFYVKTKNLHLFAIVTNCLCEYLRAWNDNSWESDSNIFMIYESGRKADAVESFAVAPSWRRRGVCTSFWHSDI